MTVYMHVPRRQWRQREAPVSVCWYTVRRLNLLNLFKRQKLFIQIFLLFTHSLILSLSLNTPWGQFKIKKQKRSMISFPLLWLNFSSGCSLTRVAALRVVLKLSHGQKELGTRTMIDSIVFEEKRVSKSECGRGRQSTLNAFTVRGKKQFNSFRIVEKKKSNRKMEIVGFVSYIYVDAWWSIWISYSKAIAFFFLFLLPHSNVLWVGSL